MDNLFEHILDKDEKIIKVFKPNKKKLFWSARCIFLLITIWIAIATIFAIVSSDDNFLTTFLIIGAVYIFIYFLTMILVNIYYKNLYYAYTNKRVVIRSGIFGIDYKSLDMAMIGALDVYVSLLDKLVCENTGSITFGSTASPINGANGSVNPYKFSNIENPYGLYREIKNIIDEYKANKNK